MNLLINIIWRIYENINYGITVHIVSFHHTCCGWYRAWPWPDRALIAADKAVDLASKKIQKMVDMGKIDATWVDAKSNSVKQASYSQGPEWVVTFKNDKLAEPSKQILYLFYSLSGQYIAANYTGN